MWIILNHLDGIEVAVNTDQCERVFANEKGLHGDIYDPKARAIIGRQSNKDVPVTESFAEVMEKFGDGWITVTDIGGHKVAIHISGCELIIPGHDQRKSGTYNYNPKARTILGHASGRETQVTETFEQVLAMVNKKAGDGRPEV